MSHKGCVQDSSQSYTLVFRAVSISPYKVNGNCLCWLSISCAHIILSGPPCRITTCNAIHYAAITCSIVLFTVLIRRDYGTTTVWYADQPYNNVSLSETVYVMSQYSLHPIMTSSVPSCCYLNMLINFENNRIVTGIAIANKVVGDKAWLEHYQASCIVMWAYWNKVDVILSHWYLRFQGWLLASHWQTVRVQQNVSTLWREILSWTIESWYVNSFETSFNETNETSSKHLFH